MVWKILTWAWRRISDICTSSDVLDWFGWKHLVVGMIAAATTIGTSLGGAPWYYSLLAGLATLLVALAIVIIWQNYQQGKSVSPTYGSVALQQVEALREHTRELQRQRLREQSDKIFKRFLDGRPRVSPLKIDFPDEQSCSEFIEERAKIGMGNVSRRILWVNIKNSSMRDVSDVRAELGRIRSWSEQGESEPHPVISSKSFPLKFHDNLSVLNLSPQMSVRLPLVSHVAHFASNFIRIEGENYEVLHQSKPWIFTVTVTAAGFPPIQRKFIVSVNGLLGMKSCDS